MAAAAVRNWVCVVVTDGAVVNETTPLRERRYYDSLRNRAVLFYQSMGVAVVGVAGGAAPSVPAAPADAFPVHVVLASHVLLSKRAIDCLRTSAISDACDAGHCLYYGVYHGAGSLAAVARVVGWSWRPVWAGALPDVTLAHTSALPRLPAYAPAKELFHALVGHPSKALIVAPSVYTPVVADETYKAFLDAMSARHLVYTTDCLTAKQLKQLMHDHPSHSSAVVMVLPTDDGWLGPCASSMLDAMDHDCAFITCVDRCVPRRAHFSDVVVHAADPVSTAACSPQVQVQANWMLDPSSLLDVLAVVTNPALSPLQTAQYLDMFMSVSFK